MSRYNLISARFCESAYAFAIKEKKKKNKEKE